VFLHASAVLVFLAHFKAFLIALEGVVLNSLTFKIIEYESYYFIYCNNLFNKILLSLFEYKSDFLITK
jgi:hypothetical protein